MEGERAEPDPQVALARARAALISVWGAATLLGIGAAATTRIGPVVMPISSSHGIHLGDLLVFVVAYLAAAVITAGWATATPVTAPRPPAEMSN
jgi:hypothetical protein